MKECERFEGMIQAYLADELSEAEADDLRQHCRRCNECGEVLELHTDLTEWGRELAKDDSVDFTSMRAAVMRRIASTTDRMERPRRWRRPSRPFVLRPVPALGAALLILVAGAVVGRSLFAPPPMETERILREMSEEAATNRRLADVEDSPYIYSNVSFQKLADDRIAIGFDVTTHVEAVEPVSAPLVKEVLVHALLNPSPLGARLRAISYAEGMMEPKIRDALIFSMHHDEALAVRLKALSMLGEYPMDEETRSAVLETLREDEAVQMRLLALDTLAKEGVDLGLIRRAVQETSSESAPALLVRIAELEQ